MGKYETKKLRNMDIEFVVSRQLYITKKSWKNLCYIQQVSHYKLTRFILIRYGIHNEIMKAFVFERIYRI